MDEDECSLPVCCSLFCLVEVCEHVRGGSSALNAPLSVCIFVHSFPTVFKSCPLCHDRETGKIAKQRTVWKDIIPMAAAGEDGGQSSHDKWQKSQPQKQVERDLCGD